MGTCEKTGCRNTSEFSIRVQDANLDETEVNVCREHVSSVKIVLTAVPRIV